MMKCVRSGNSLYSVTAVECRYALHVGLHDSRRNHVIVAARDHQQRRAIVAPDIDRVSANGLKLASSVWNRM